MSQRVKFAGGALTDTDGRRTDVEDAYALAAMLANTPNDLACSAAARLRQLADVVERMRLDAGPATGALERIERRLDEIAEWHGLTGEES